MASAPDMELKKAFTELQMKMVDTKQKIKFTDMQVMTFYIHGINALQKDCLCVCVVCSNWMSYLQK